MHYFSATGPVDCTQKTHSFDRLGVGAFPLQRLKVESSDYRKSTYTGENFVSASFNGRFPSFGKKRA